MARNSSGTNKEIYCKIEPLLDAIKKKIFLGHILVMKNKKLMTKLCQLVFHSV